MLCYMCKLLKIYTKQHEIENNYNFNGFEGSFARVFFYHLEIQKHHYHIQFYK